MSLSIPYRAPTSAIPTHALAFRLAARSALATLRSRYRGTWAAGSGIQNKKSHTHTTLSLPKANLHPT